MPRGSRGGGRDAARLDPTQRVETHMPSDRPGLIMRRRLPEPLKEQGQPEVTKRYPTA